MVKLNWQATKTLSDLGELTALWLEGKIPSRPGYEGGPDEETVPLIGALAAVNRAGYVTTASQPGYDGPGYDGAHWRQRAGVDGFADDSMRELLAAAAKQLDLIFIQHKAGRRTSHQDAVTVTERKGRRVTGFGVCLSRRHIQDSWAGYGICPHEAQDALCEAWQVTIVDPEWGRDDRLWAMLADIRVRGE